MISRIRRLIGQNKAVKQLFNKLGGTDYAIYDRTNIIVGSKFIDYFVTKDGAKYKVDGYSNFMVEETRLEYDWSDIRSEDIVVDIGANIGGFTIGAALKAKHVYAIEPIFYKELGVNVALNGLTNVTVIPWAIGDGGTIDLSFNKIERKNVPTNSLTNIISAITQTSKGHHKVSFLKCDCEGGEWYIKPDELAGIRRIEMEIHPTLPPTEQFNPGFVDYIKKNWSVTLDEVNATSYMLHAHPRSCK